MKNIIIKFLGMVILMIVSLCVNINAIMQGHVFIVNILMTIMYISYLIWFLKYASQYIQTSQTISKLYDFIWGWYIFATIMSYAIFLTYINNIDNITVLAIPLSLLFFTPFSGFMFAVEYLQDMLGNTGDAMTLFFGTICLVIVIIGYILRKKEIQVQSSDLKKNSILKKISVILCVIFGLCVLWGIQSQHYVEYDTPNIPVCYLNGGYYGIEEEGDYQIISRLDDTFVYYGTIESFNKIDTSHELNTNTVEFMNRDIYSHKDEHSYVLMKIDDQKYLKLNSISKVTTKKYKPEDSLLKGGDEINQPQCYVQGHYYMSDNNEKFVAELDDSYLYYGTIEIYNPNSRIGETEDLDLTTKTPMYMNIKIYVHKNDDTHIYAKMRENKFIKLYYSS